MYSSCVSDGSSARGDDLEQAAVLRRRDGLFGQTAEDRRRYRAVILAEFTAMMVAPSDSGMRTLTLIALAAHGS